jgi:hypothetical protein
MSAHLLSEVLLTRTSALPASMTIAVTSSCKGIAHQLPADRTLACTGELGRGFADPLLLGSRRMSPASVLPARLSSPPLMAALFRIGFLLVLMEKVPRFAVRSALLPLCSLQTTRRVHEDWELDWSLKDSPLNNWQWETYAQ